MAEAAIGVGDLPAVALLWLEITQQCQLACVHCYASSGPAGSHGSMTVETWISVIDQAAAAGVRVLKFIGGEPTLHPGLPDLVTHAVRRGLRVSIYSNLLRISPRMWRALALPGVELETSYYSDLPEQHEAITGRRGSHRRTTQTMREARNRGVPVRAGLVAVHPGQRIDQACERLRMLGVRVTCVDRVRRIGRGAGGGHGERLDELCGRCARDRLAICSDGAVRPCVLARWITLGNVHQRELASIMTDGARLRTYAQILAACRAGGDGQHPEARCPP
jgi:MoaA/NifB/PqqE/SkfB family radical SAM enzyme